MKRMALLAAILLTSINTPATTINVTSTADSGPGTLREALANAGDGDAIDASGVTGAIVLTTGELLVSNSVTITGPGPANLAIDGNLPNTTNRVFHITNSVTVVIASLTITNGSAGKGAGIYNDHASLTVSNCTVTGNLADFGAGIFSDGSSNRTASLTIVDSHLSGNSAVFRGGGAYNWGGNGTATLQIVTSTLASNSANFGGGIFNDGESDGSASLQIAGSTLSDNSGFTGGGGIYNDSLSNGVASLTITNSTLTGNSTTNSGGAVYYFGASAGGPTQHVVDSTVNGNSAGERGGGIYNDGFFGGAVLTITHTTLSNNSAGISGGAIFNDGESGGTATVEIVSSGLDGNSADFGGAIYNDGFSGSVALTITNSALVGNSAGSNGGTIFNDGESGGDATLHIASTDFINNSASFGGALYNDGEQGSAMLEITGSHLGANTSASDGAVIYNDAEIDGNATLQITDSTLTDNSSGGDGGAIFNDGTDNGTATVKISASLIADNSSAGSFGGGAVYNWGVTGNATLQIDNSTLFRNTAVFGGAIFNDGAGQCCAMLQIANSTLSSNSADLGGAIYNDGSSGGGATLEIGNTILDAGASSGTLTNDSGTVTSRGYNLSSDTGNGQLTASTDQINTDPMLGPLQDNGGLTLTHALSPGSPALDKGKQNTIAALASNTDQRGLPRPVDDPAIANAAGGDGSDIGAYEAQTVSPQPHDLAIVKLKAPKKITFKSGVTSVTGKFAVTIQNNATHNEIIPNFATLQNLVTVSVQSLSNCPSFAATMTLPKKAFPLTLAPNKKLKLAFTGTFNCVNDPLASSKTAPHPDYKTVAHVSYAALDGIPDTVPANDDCPHNPFGTDKGCGGKTVAGTLGADVLTDVVVK